jgi:hypothetical protein
VSKFYMKLSSYVTGNTPRAALLREIIAVGCKHNGHRGHAVGFLVRQHVVMQLCFELLTFTVSSVTSNNHDRHLSSY